MTISQVRRIPTSIASRSTWSSKYAASMAGCQVGSSERSRSDPRLATETSVGATVTMRVGSARAARCRRTPRGPCAAAGPAPASPSRLAKNAPASPMLDASGPVPRAFQRAKLRTLLSWARSVAPLVCQSIGTTGWSCRFAPTPARSTRVSIPTSARWLPGPMPESISSCGLLIEPPHSSTSRRARHGLLARRPAGR